MRFVQVDVFAERPYQGNPLAVFPDAPSLSDDQMQRIAREMNLSETTFVTRSESDRYDVRIFTPTQELPFAGHPTLGTCAVLRRLALVDGERVTQRSAAGSTVVEAAEDVFWFSREGKAEPDLDPTDVEALARALAVEPNLLSVQGGRSEWPALKPAFSDVGLRQLMVPVRDRSALRGLTPRFPELAAVADTGAYCFTFAGDQDIEARGFFPAVGIDEDPATGSAAAGLGIYLADRIGGIDVAIAQGVQVGRPSRIMLRAAQDAVAVGGRVVTVLHGELTDVP